MPRTTQSH